MCIRDSHNEADPLSRRPDFSSEIPCVSAATTWRGGEVPESGQPILPGDATDVLGGATNENVSPTLDMTDVSADLLTQIRQGYEADPFYRQSTLQVGANLDSRFTRNLKTGLWIYLGKRICVPKGGALKRAILYELHDSPSGGHPSAKRTMARVVARFYFPDMIPFVSKIRRRVYDVQPC